MTHEPVDGIGNEKVIEFVNEVGPYIKKYLGEDKGVILSVCTGGVYYGMRLRSYLIEGRDPDDVLYGEIEKENISLDSLPVDGRKIVVVDDAVGTGSTYKKLMANLEPQIEKSNAEDLIYVVYNDMIGFADCSANRGWTRKKKKKGILSSLFNI